MSTHDAPGSDGGAGNGSSPRKAGLSRELLHRFAGSGPRYHAQVFVWSGAPRPLTPDVLMTEGQVSADGLQGELRLGPTQQMLANLEKSGSSWVSSWDAEDWRVTRVSGALVPGGGVNFSHPLFGLWLLDGADQRSAQALQASGERLVWTGTVSFKRARERHRLKWPGGPLTRRREPLRSWIAAVPIAVDARSGELVVTVDMAGIDEEPSWAAAKFTAG